VARPTIVVVIVIHHGIVDDFGLIDNLHPGSIRSIVMVWVVMVNPCLWEKNPVERREIYTHIDRYSRSKRSPAIISTTGSPANPSRSPFVARNPGPTLIVIIKIPSAIMERSPSPVIIRYPSVAIFRHYPSTIGAIRMKIIIHSW